MASQMKIVVMTSQTKRRKRASAHARQVQYDDTFVVKLSCIIVTGHRVSYCGTAGVTDTTPGQSRRSSESSYAASSEYTDESGVDSGDDSASTSSSGTWVTDNGSSDEEAAVAAERKDIEGYVGDVPSDEELEKKVWLTLSNLNDS